MSGNSFADGVYIDAFLEGINQILFEFGYARDGLYWRKSHAETVTVFHAQRSSWGSAFDINIGVYVPKLDKSKTRRPTMRRLHAWARLDQLRAEAGSPSGISFDGDHDANNQRVVRALDDIKKLALPVLRDFSTLRGIAEVIQQYGAARIQAYPELLGLLRGSAEDGVCSGSDLNGG